MARIIFISNYLRGGIHASHLANRTRYFATREGVELLKDSDVEIPATKKQHEYVQRLVRGFPDAKDLVEYEDFSANPTQGNVHSFVEQVRELYIDQMDDAGKYIDYLANRPGVQSYGEHGLWDANGKVESLTRVMEEVSNHNGVVWSPIISIPREDAERLGYNDAENWRALVNASTADIAKGYKINPEHLRWYAAFHRKENQVHIHMLIYSTNPKEGYLTKDGIRTVKAAFAKQIFRQDMISVYEKQTELRNTLQRDFQSLMEELVTKIESGTIQNERLNTLVEELAQRLQNTSGKKVYGYLPATSKRLVDAIVDEFAKDPRIEEAYKLWYEMRDEVCSVYNEQPPERKPLSQQKEFKPVRNMVIREVMKLIEKEFTFDDSTMHEEPDWDDEQETENSTNQTGGSLYSRIFSYRKDSQFQMQEQYQRVKHILLSEDTDPVETEDACKDLEKLWNKGYSNAAHLLGCVYRDGLPGKPDLKSAEVWFQRSAEAGDKRSEYALGKLLLEQGRLQAAKSWLEQSAEHGNSYAQYHLGKLYLSDEVIQKDTELATAYLKASASQGNQYAQYALGKMYLFGQEIKQDRTQAVEWLSRSAAQGNPYAQHLLDRKDNSKNIIIGNAVIRMLHHIGNIFRQKAAETNTYTGTHIDKKRRMEMLDKRIAMGHKIDDHEDPVSQQRL